MFKWVIKYLTGLTFDTLPFKFIFLFDRLLHLPYVFLGEVQLRMEQPHRKLLPARRLHKACPLPLIFFLIKVYHLISFKVHAILFIN
mmetsp:Transcript_28861/g.27755  ORF Transcript_28861/g.27755 Transcript_28861/m.27755 type:complete len:87 (-) Transcript_28861:132-392(-)